MEKIKKLLTSVNTVLIVFTLLGLRAVVYGASIGDALFILSIAALLGLKDYLKSIQTPDINEEIKKEIDSIRTYVSAMSIKQGIKDIPKELPKDVKRLF